MTGPDTERKIVTPEKIKSFAGTAVIYGCVFAALMFSGFTIPSVITQGEGIEVNFGTDATGFGDIEPSPPAGKEEVLVPPPSLPPATAKPPAASKESKEEALLTQNNEESPAVKKVDPDAEKKRIEKAEADKKHREEVEAERIRVAQEEAERNRIAADQKRASDIMNKTKNALTNARNSGTSSTSEGIAGGTGNQGVPNGSVDSKNHGPGDGGTGTSGVSYSLLGRGVQKLPLPKYDYQGGGKVVVEVSVDRSGKVIQAIPGIKGSTTLEEYLLKVAKDAAMEATFEVKSDAPLVQKGTITYNFVLR
jgi:colicin import membrane protein